MAEDKEQNEPIPIWRFLVFGLTAINRGLVIVLISPTNYFYFKDMTNDENQAKLYTSQQSVLYHIGAIISYMLTGFIIDTFRRIKMLIILFNFTHAVAMGIYSVPVPEAPLSAQLLNGLSSALIIVVNYSLTMNVSYKQMGKYLTWVSLAGDVSNIGIILVIFVYPRVNTHLGSWHIWQGNLPGITMFFTYLLSMVTCFVCYDKKSGSQEKKTPKQDETCPLVDDKVEADKPNTKKNTEKIPFKDKVRKYLKDSAVLFSSFDTVALMLHGIFLASVRTTFEVLIPIAVSDCFRLDASKSVLIVVLPAVPLSIMWFILPFILKKISYYNLLLVFTFGILILLFMQCFLDERALCYMVVVTFFYITVFLIPAKRALMVAIFGYTVPGKVLGTAHSSYELTLKLSGMCGALLVGVFANHKRILCAIELTIGLLSTLCLLLRRHRLSKPVENKENKE